MLKLDALTAPSHSLARDGISIPGHNGPDSVGSPSSSSLLLSPTSLTGHLVSVPSAGASSGHTLTDREREKALYPGRVILASEFLPFIACISCPTSTQPKRVCNWTPSQFTPLSDHSFASICVTIRTPPPSMVFLYTIPLTTFHNSLSRPTWHQTLPAPMGSF